MKKILEKILGRIKNFFLNLKSKLMGKRDKDYSLEEVRDAFEDYIGLIIVEFEAYDDNIEDIEEDILGKMITQIDTDNKNIYIGLADLSGNRGGFISLEPTITGRFAERIDDGMMSNWSAKYKITFIGGASIEYMDTQRTGSVSYTK